MKKHEPKHKYETKDFELIALAIGKQTSDVTKYKALIEAAARWYGLDCGLPKPRAPRTPPSKMQIKLSYVAKSARRLLKHLGIQATKDAYDGPGSLELIETLAWADGYDEDAVTIA